MPLTRTSGPGRGKTPDAGSVTPGPVCGHGRALTIMRRGNATAWCFVCEKIVVVLPGRR